MEQNKKYKKVISLLCLLSLFFVLMTIAAAFFFLVLQPLLPDVRGIQLFLNMGWLYFCGYLYYRLTQRCTNWWTVFENEEDKIRE